MASEEEVRLGRLAVKRGFVTEAQVVDALRARNAKKDGDLGYELVARGLLKPDELPPLRDAARKGDGGVTPRDEASTDMEISISGTREVLARDMLLEAIRSMKRDPRSALRELKRLASEFADTESGVQAEQEARDLSTSQPDLEKS
jgi:hypothetical protein